MGVGVSAHRLAGTVASLGAVGTIASVDLRRHHPDLLAATAHAPKAEVDAANLVALDREIVAARALAAGRGMVAVNVMRAVSEYARYVRQSCVSGADAIVVGAGLPLDLPDLSADPPRGRADTDPLRCPRHRADREEVGAQGTPAGRDRDRASALRGRAPRRGEDRRPRRPALRFRERDSGDARVLPRRGHRRRRDTADPRGRHQHPRARPRTHRARRLGGAARNRVRGDRGGRRRRRFQARARRRRRRRTSSSS